MCNINNNGSIDIGTSTYLGLYSNKVQNKTKIGVLNENKVAVFFENNSTTLSDFIIEGVICDINNLSITVGTKTTVVSDSNDVGEAFDIVVLNMNKIFLYYTYRTSSNPIFTAKAAICYLSNNSITRDVETGIVANINQSPFTASFINSNRVLITYTIYKSSGHDYLYARICSINGTTITAYDATQFTSTPSVSAVEAIKYDTNKVLIKYILRDYPTHTSGNYYYLYFNLCTLNNNNTTITIDKNIKMSEYAGNAKIFKIDTNRILLSYSQYSSGSLDNYYIRIINILENNLNFSTKIFIEGIKIFDAMFDYFNFISFSEQKDGNNYAIYAQIINFNKLIKKLILSEEINGVATTSGADGQTVQFVTPNYID